MRALLLLPLVVPGWIVAASGLLCAFTRKTALFVFPYVQWIQAARWYREVGWLMRIAVITSGLLPTIVTILLAVAVYQIGRRPNSTGVQSLYGTTGWASREEMERSGISLTRPPRD